MTQPSPDPDPGVAVELERIRRTLEVGFTRTDGALALLVQRNDQTDHKLDDLETRLDDLERRRWPLPTVAALVGFGGFALAALGQLAAR
ncbi:hypothetical protein ACFWY6_14805 [Streptomyces sp. NPDC059037]|uniref:hypothetical protein n=1 Tax=Streptomyces sp. NPDC059037 TaxID=3346710 RepID=UPI0036C5E538